MDGTEQHTEGPAWHNNKLYLNDFLQPDIEEASFTISSISDMNADFKITIKNQWLTCSKTSGSLDGKEKTMDVISVKIDRSAMNDETEGSIVVEMQCGTCTIIVNASQKVFSDLSEMTFVETNGYISIEAEHYFLNKEATNQQGDVHRFQVLEGYGKTLSALKAFPTTEYFTVGKDAPYLEYHFVVQEAGVYELELYMQPSNPVATDYTLFCGIQANEDDINIVNVLPEGYRVDDQNWAVGVLDNIHKHSSCINCNEGLNTLRIYAVSPGFVLEKLVIYPEGKKPANSYLGPTETYYVGK